MAGIYGVSAYQQNNQSWKNSRVQSETAKTDSSSGTDTSVLSKEKSASKIQSKEWSPVSQGSSLIPKTSEYGMVIGDVQLSDKAKDYYNQLKSKFHNMEFIAVSKDMKSQVQANAASYGNANKQVVLIDDEKIERMATDESFRKKYEGIIAMSQVSLQNAKNSLASSGAAVKSFGMSVDSNGKESFFATVEKSQDLQKKRIEKKAVEKKEQKIRDKKKAEKKAKEEQLKKAKEKDKADKSEQDEETNTVQTDDDKEYVTIEAHSMESLLSKVQRYSYDKASANVMTEAERSLGAHVDFKG